MHLLVLAREKADRDCIGRMIGAKHRVDLAADVKEARSAFERGAPAAVIVAWPPSGGLDLLAQLRALGGEPQPHVIALLGERVASEIAEVCAGKVEDFVRRPWCSHELLARIDAPERRRQEATPGLDLGSLKTYARIGEVVCADLAAMLGEPLKLTSGWTATATSSRLRGASVPLSLAADGTELRISILTDPGSLQVLGERLLGDADAGAAALDDAIRELANTAAGGVKRAYLTESVTLTTGIPVDQQALPSEDKVTRWWCATLPSGRLRLAIVGQVVRRPKQHVQAARLHEGMVVARDLRSESGALLVPAGMRLTATSASRIAQILGARFLVEVTAAA